MFDRRRSIGFALLLGALTAVGVARSIPTDSLFGLVISLVIFGAPAAFFASLAARRRPALVIDSHSLVEGRSGRVVPWDTVTDVRLGIERGLFRESHHLVLTLAQSESPPPRRFITTNATNPNEVDIDLDWLATPWRDVVSIVEQGFGRRVIRTHERPLRGA
jgi:hypothetical protein